MEEAERDIREAAEAASRWSAEVKGHTEEAVDGVLT